MNLTKLICTSLFLAGSLFQPSLITAYADEPTVEDFATRPVIGNVRVSPDGKYIAYRIAQTRKGDYAIEVREVGDLSKDPVRLGAETMSITGFQWLSNEDILVSFTQRVRDMIKEQNVGVFETKRAITRADGSGRFIPVFDDLTLASSLPNDPQHVLVRTAKFNREDIAKLRAQGRALGDIRVRDFYRMNVSTGALRLVLQGNARFGGYDYDLEGNPRITSEYLPSSRENVILARGTSEDAEWEEIYRFNVDDYGNRFSPLGFDPENDNVIFVAATRNQDTASVYEFNLISKSFGEKIFEIEGQDIEFAFTSSNPLYPGKIVGFGYYDKDGRVDAAFLDAEAEAFRNSLKATFPGQDVSVPSQSVDESVRVIYVDNWDNPGSYYLLTPDGLSFFANVRPTLEADDLSEQIYVTYTSRDGRKIPAYVTLPKGDGPHPVVVMPHGGPWVSYRPGVFDEWSQLLASKGFVVIDPLFRGTTGLGTDHWVSSFGEWGQTMSDDMDDGITYLANQGLVDPDRAAMFGWSFGGYSALAASIRSPQPYQCVIAGAAVSDPVEFRSAFVGNRVIRSQLEVGYDGLIAVDKTDEVSVPVLLIHGDLDQRVRIIHSEQFVRGLERNNKPHKFVVLEGADHFDNTLTYDHRVQMYNAMIDFLENDCGLM